VLAPIDGLIARIGGPARTAEDPLLECARRRLFDTAVACTIGLNLLDAQAFRLLLSQGTAASIQALVAATRATEIDDIAISGCVTPGSVVVPVALVCAAEGGLPLSSMLDSIVDGYEAMIAMAEAIDGAHVVYRGVWPTLASAPAGAVVTAGRLMGMTPTALNRALIQATVTNSARPDAGASRWPLLGNAAAHGVGACRDNQTHSDDGGVLKNWANAQEFDYVPGRITAAAPGIMRVDTKPFPTARQGLAAICAFRQLVAHFPLQQDDAIVVNVPKIYAAMIGGTQLPTNRIQSLLQVSYQIALAALAPARLYDVGRENLPASSQFAEFLGRMSVVSSSELDLLYPNNWAGSVSFGRHTDLTTRVHQLVIDPEGSAALAHFGWEELATKAARLAQANSIAPERFITLEKLVRGATSPKEILEFILVR